MVPRRCGLAALARHGADEEQQETVYWMEPLAGQKRRRREEPQQQQRRRKVLRRLLASAQGTAYDCAAKLAKVAWQGVLRLVASDLDADASYAASADSDVERKQPVRAAVTQQLPMPAAEHAEQLCEQHQQQVWGAAATVQCAAVLQLASTTPSLGRLDCTVPGSMRQALEPAVKQGERSTEPAASGALPSDTGDEAAQAVCQKLGPAAATAEARAGKPAPRQTPLGQVSGGQAACEGLPAPASPRPQLKVRRRMTSEGTPQRGRGKAAGIAARQTAAATPPEAAASGQAGSSTAAQRRPWELAAAGAEPAAGDWPAAAGQQGQAAAPEAAERQQPAESSEQLLLPDAAAEADTAVSSGGSCQAAEPAQPARLASDEWQARSSRSESCEAAQPPLPTADAVLPSPPDAGGACPMELAHEAPAAEPEPGVWAAMLGSPPDAGTLSRLLAQEGMGEAASPMSWEGDSGGADSGQSALDVLACAASEAHAAVAVAAGPQPLRECVAESLLPIEQTPVQQQQQLVPLERVRRVSFSLPEGARPGAEGGSRRSRRVRPLPPEESAERRAAADAAAECLVIRPCGSPRDWPGDFGEHLPLPRRLAYREPGSEEALQPPLWTELLPLSPALRQRHQAAEQSYREAELNCRLASAWAAGEAWAATDYHGLPLDSGAAACHTAAQAQAWQALQAVQGPMGAGRVRRLVQREWELLRAIRSQHAAGGGGCKQEAADAGRPRSILKKRARVCC